MRRIYIWGCPSCLEWQVECDGAILDEQAVLEVLQVALNRHYYGCATKREDKVATQGWTFCIVEIA